MIHLAWMLLILSAPDCVADALPDCLPARPVTVAVAITDPADHYAAHDLNAALRNQHGGWDKCGAAYLGGGKSAVAEQPPLRLSEVATAVPVRWRGTGWQTYMVDMVRVWDRQPLFLLDEQSAYASGSEWYAKNQPSAYEHSAYRAREISRYCTVLLRLARALPGYDSRQLAAIVECQWLRVGALPETWPRSLAGPAGVRLAQPKPMGEKAPAQKAGVVVGIHRGLQTPPCCPDGNCAVPWQPARPSSAGARADTHNGPSLVTRTDNLELPSRTEQALETDAKARPAPADAPAPTYHVVTYTAAWCAPCRTLKPLWAKLRNRGVLVTEADVDHLPTWIKEKPASVPHTMLYRWDGKAWVFVKRWHGAGFEKAIEAVLKTN